MTIYILEERDDLSDWKPAKANGSFVGFSTRKEANQLLDDWVRKTPKMSRRILEKFRQRYRVTKAITIGTSSNKRDGIVVGSRGYSD